MCVCEGEGEGECGGFLEKRFRSHQVSVCAVALLLIIYDSRGRGDADTMDLTFPNTPGKSFTRALPRAQSKRFHLCHFFSFFFFLM